MTLRWPVRAKKEPKRRLLLLHDHTARGLTRAEKQTLCLMAQRAGAVSALFTAEDAPADTTLQLEDYPPCAILPGSLPEDPMEAQPLTALSDIRVDACFIGGCSSGRIEELREAAEILRGHHIRRELRLLIGFASNTDYLQAMEEAADRCIPGLRSAGHQSRLRLLPDHLHRRHRGWGGHGLYRVLPLLRLLRHPRFPGLSGFCADCRPGGAQRISLSSVTGGHNYGYCFYGPDMEAAR